MSLTTKIIEKIKNEVSKEDFNFLLMPLYNCIYPYYFMIIILFLIIILMLILILTLIRIKK